MKLLKPWFMLCVDGEDIMAIYGPFPTEDDAIIHKLEMDNSLTPCDYEHMITDKEPPLNYMIFQVVTKTEHMYPVRDWMDERKLRELAYKGYPLG